MCVQRGKGELCLQCGTRHNAGEIPPPKKRRPPLCKRLARKDQKIDPNTLATIPCSPDLPSGGHMWCGAVVAHANGDLYMMNGRFAHRLKPDCSVVAECELLFDCPYNGIMILSDGNLIAENLGNSADQPCLFSVLEPENLSTVCEIKIEASCTTIGSGRQCVDDRPGPAVGVAVVQGSSAPQRAFRFSLDDPSDCNVLDVIGTPNAFDPGPPLYDPGDANPCALRHCGEHAGVKGGDRGAEFLLFFWLMS